MFDEIKIEQSVFFNKDNGLPGASIGSLAEDQHGFIWLATSGGLTRFDGSSFKTFLPSEEDTTSIFTELTSRLLIDKDKNNLWVGTFYGLSVMDLETEKFKNYQFEHFKQRDSLSKKIPTRVLSLLKDSKGNIWAGTFSDGLFRYDEEQDTFFNYRYSQEEVALSFPTYTNIDHILALHQDQYKDSVIWIGTTAGLLELNIYTDQLSWHLYPKKEEKNFISQNAIRYIYQDTEGLLYLSSWYAGVNIFNPRTRKFTPLPIKNEDQEERLRVSTFLSRPIGLILPKNKTELFINTSNGLVTYDYKKKKSVRIQKSNHKKNRIYGVKYIDSQNRAWHYNSKGLHMFNPINQQFIPYDYGHLNPNYYGFTYYILSDSDSSKITILPRSTEGVFFLAPDNNSWGKFSINEKHLAPGGGFSPTAYSRSPDNTWTIADRFNIYAFDPIRKSFTPFKIPHQFTQKEKRGLLWDKAGNLWIGFRDTGILRWTRAENKWEHFQKELEEGKPIIRASQIRVFFEDSQNNIWIRRGGGFSVYDTKRDTFYNFLQAINPKNTLTNIHNIFEDSKGRVWLDGNRSNLGYADVYNFQKGIIRKIDLQDSHNIISFEHARLDSNDNLWGIGKENLIQLSLQHDSLEVNIHSMNYSIKEFNDIYGFEILSDDRFVIGGLNKIWLTNPKKFLINNEKPKPYISGISVLQNTYKSKIAPHLISQLDLNHRENFFSFDFSSIGFSQGNENKFRYRLINFEDEWTDAGERKFANFTNVPSGQYIFELQAANNLGVWNEEPLQLPINIATPWWRTGWFWGILVLGLIGIAYLFYQWRIEQVRKEERLKSGFEQQLANVKMSALRAQMNPHFIFNSLNSIEFYIMNNERERAVDYLGRFSRLIRLILQNSKNPSIPLQDELEALKIYMEMECIRFENLFEYEVKTEQNLLKQNLLIPPMLIQPYVENAIWHGIRQKTEGLGKIKINLFRSNGHLVCHIEDNGIGREAAQKLKSKSSAKRKSYGMKITSERLDILNKLDNVKADVKIIDLKDQLGHALGTKVELRLPINKDVLT